MGGMWSLTLTKVKKLSLSLVWMTWCNLNFHLPQTVNLEYLKTSVNEHICSKYIEYNKMNDNKENELYMAEGYESLA
jgi:hypothetical protein